MNNFVWLLGLWVLQWQWMFYKYHSFIFLKRVKQIWNPIEVQACNENAKSLLKAMVLLLFCDEIKHSFLFMCCISEIMIWSEVVLVWFCLLTKSSCKCRNWSTHLWSFTIKTTEILLLQRDLPLHPPNCLSIMI